MRILLSGYYGFGNAGDEAVLLAITGYFKEKFKDAEITVLSSNPALTEEFYKVKAVNRSNLSSIRKAIKNCDALISGGGNLFQDTTSFKSLLYYLLVIWMAKFYRKKVAIFGQGIGPLKRKISKLLLKWTLNRVDLIILRDNQSYLTLEKLGIKKDRVYVSIDPTMLLDPPGQEDAVRILSLEGIRQKQKPILGISVRPLNNPNKEEIYKSIAQTADHFAEKHNYQIVFLLFYPPLDMDATSKVISYMKSSSTIIFRQCSTKELLSIISQFDLFLGVRLHSLVFSALVNTPAVGISYDPKVEGFLSEVSLPCVQTKGISSAEIVGRLEAMLFQKHIQQNHLKVVVSEMRRRAQNAFVILSDFIFPPSKLDVLGVKVHVVDMFLAKLETEELIRSKKHHIVFTPNPEIIVAAQEDEKLKQVLNSASLSVPDGAAMVVLSPVFGAKLPERVTGIDLMLELLELAQKKKYRVFLLGSEQEVIKKAVSNLIQQYPELNIVGYHHGYFTEDAEVIGKIREAAPDILFVGLGAPRQEFWIHENLSKMPPLTAVAVGGSLDVISGQKQRAPEWIRKANIEWFYRLIKEPWRIKRQAALLKFLYLVWKNKR